MSSGTPHGSSPVAGDDGVRPGVGAPSRAGRAPRRLRRILALDDLEPAARRQLPRPVFGFVAGGAETATSRRGNRAAYGDYHFIPRMLIETTTRSQTTTLFDQCFRAPFGIAPMGGTVLAAYQGDIVLARAAAKAGIPFVLSASSLIPMERVVQANPDAWFQAYLPGEPDRIAASVARVAAAGFGVFVLTVDLPVPGNRENNIRNGFSLPLQPSVRLARDGMMRPRWLLGNAVRTLSRTGMPHFENMDAMRGPPILSSNTQYVPSAVGMV